jgi:hypothetical protein
MMNQKKGIVQQCYTVLFVYGVLWPVRKEKGAKKLGESSTASLNVSYRKEDCGSRAIDLFKIINH